MNVVVEAAVFQARRYRTSVRTLEIIAKIVMEILVQDSLLVGRSSILVYQDITFLNTAHIAIDHSSGMNFASDMDLIRAACDTSAAESACVSAVSQLGYSASRCIPDTKGLHTMLCDWPHD